MLPAPTATASRHSSETAEHYTPAIVVTPARATLGAFDLDPASCAFANELVEATRFYTEATNGLFREWDGRVFLNPPGGESDNQGRRVVKANKAKGEPGCKISGSCGLPPGHTHEDVEASAKRWWFKLAEEHRAGRVEAAIFVAFSVELLQVTQVNTPPGASIPLDFPICFPSRRVPYDREVNGARVKGGSPPHASAIVCVSHDFEVWRRFREAFSPLGRVTGRPE
jgi:hypothetical protein